MKTTRSNVFETNSSSVHTVCIQPVKKDLEPRAGLYFDVDDDNNIVVHMHEFGWSGSCETPEEKLSYLCLLIWSFLNQIGNPAVNSVEGSFFLADEKEYAKAAETVENTEEFDRIRRILKEKFKCNDVIISRDNSDGYIDHQSTDYYNNIDEWYDSHGIKDDEDIYNFLVGPSYIEIDNDNH